MVADLDRFSCLWSAMDLGEIRERILALGCAIELLHKASLIHDDIVDEDVFRRGRPTLWRQYGKRKAIVVGDLLVGTAVTSVADWAMLHPCSRKDRVVSVFSRAVLETAVGELLDLEFETRERVSREDILCMTGRKSGALPSASMQVAGVVTGAPDELCTTLGRIGWNIGLIFQMINDLNNFSDIDAWSKHAVGQDLAQKKKNFATLGYRRAPATIGATDSIDYLGAPSALEAAEIELRHQVEKTLRDLDQLPSGPLRQTLTQALNSARENWFWTASDTESLDDS